MMAKKKPAEPCDHDHGFWLDSNPFWAWSIKFGGVVGLLVLLLWLSADNFDETELMVIAGFAGVVGLGKGAAFVVEKLKK